MNEFTLSELKETYTEEYEVWNTDVSLQRVIAFFKSIYLTQYFASDVYQSVLKKFLKNNPRYGYHLSKNIWRFLCIYNFSCFLLIVLQNKNQFLHNLWNYKTWLQNIDNVPCVLLWLFKVLFKNCLWKKMITYKLVLSQRWLVIVIVILVSSSVNNYEINVIFFRMIPVYNFQRKLLIDKYLNNFNKL